MARVSGHVWTAPALQGEFGAVLPVGCSHVSGLFARPRTAGHDVIRGSGTQNHPSDLDDHAAEQGSVPGTVPTGESWWGRCSAFFKGKAWVENVGGNARRRFAK